MARILVSTKDLPHEKWLEYRRTGIGGSDASTIVGLNPYSSLYKLYMDKIGLLSDVADNEAMRQGRDLEEYVAKRFCEATGKKVCRRNLMFQHDKYDYILADIDRDIVGENAGLECKTTSMFNKSDLESGEIPLTYYVQMTHYALYRLKNGGYGFEVMSVDEAMEHGRRYSKSFNNSPWQTNPEEMMKKTVLKKVLKYAPVCSDFVKGASVDETTQVLVDNDNEINVIQADYDEVESSDNIKVDSTTGEVIE